MTFNTINAKNKINIGIFASSHPAHIWFSEKYEHAKINLIKKGFTITEGSIVNSKKNQNYRTDNAQERAREFMELIENPLIDIIIPVIGGYNTASILPYLNFEKIRQEKKIICGYSDITALHMAIIKKSQIPTVYGPMVVPSFGEYSGIPQYTFNSFMNVILGNKSIELKQPNTWSNYFLNAFTDEWKTKKRQYEKNQGWKILKNGSTCGKVIVANINTLVSMLGTKYVPSFEDNILILEEMDASINLEERNLNALKLSGVFENLKGLIFSKPEKFDDIKSGFKYEDIINEVLGNVSYPVVYNFDCGHTIPMISIPQLSTICLNANDDYAKIYIEENSILKLRHLV